MQSNIYEELINKELIIYSLNQVIIGKLVQIDGDILIIKTNDKKGNLKSTNYVNKNMIETIALKQNK